jgi:N-acetyl-gamma-glutamyl-phosphate reductase
MSYRVGVVGISGYGGGEALRILASHPDFELVYAAGESSAGSRIAQRFPSMPRAIGDLVVSRFDPTSLPELDLLIASLPGGESSEALSQVPEQTRIVDIGGDHRYADGWTYGLADVFPDDIANSTRIANPGCYPASALIAIAPLLSAELIDSDSLIIIDSKSGVSGAGRGGGSTFGYAEVNEDVSAYGLLKHAHLPELSRTIARLSRRDLRIAFTPHLIPMTRGILSTIYLQGDATTESCVAAAADFYKSSAFVRVSSTPPHTKWCTGTNLAFVHYACDPSRKLIQCVSAIDNLGKGAAGQAIQNANLMFGLEETAGLTGSGLWP